MEAQTEALGPVATRKLFENDDVRVWEMDLKPGDVCGLHHHTLDYVLFILSSASVGVESPGRKPYTLPAKARGVYFVPAGGIESAHNVGSTRFFEALFEFKRPPRKGAERLGFVGCEALAEREPEPGMVTILDNDRARVWEITLAPGGESRMRRWSHDSVAYAAEGGEIKVVEHDGDGERTHREMLDAGAVRWYPHGVERRFANLGTNRLRLAVVEIK